MSVADPGQLAQRNVGEGMVIDPSLLVATQRFAGLNPAWLAACVATLDVGLRRFALLGGTNQVMRVGFWLLSQYYCTNTPSVSRLESFAFSDAYQPLVFSTVARGEWPIRLKTPPPCLVTLINARSTCLH